ncbi:MAG TPA: CHAD domain-containing protein [Gaiellaceae bacterium]
MDGADAVRARAYAISQGADAGTPFENWVRAERELAVASDYDTVDRDLEAAGLALSRLPSEAGVVWRLALPLGELVEEWEPGNLGLAPPDAVARLIDAVVGGKPLVPSPPVSADPGAARLRDLLGAQRDALLRHDPGVRVGLDPENLHQHRVAARRARALLRATRPWLDAEWRRALSGRLRELGEASGPVRDLDVLIAHVEAEVGSLDADERPVGRLLLALLHGRRESDRRRLVETLNGAGYRRVLSELLLPPRLADGVEAVPLRKLGRKELRRLAAAVDRAGSRPDDEAVHALRIVLKRARYAAELAAPDGKARKRFLADARALQDLLGEHQDAAVAEKLLRDAVVADEPTAVAFVAGRLAARQQERRERVRALLPHAWKRLRKSGRRVT